VERAAIASLFEGWENTLILLELQGDFWSVAGSSLFAFLPISS
jgi:hypothetical protein